MTTKEIMEKELGRKLEDEEVIYILVDLRRMIKKGQEHSLITLLREQEKTTGKEIL